MEAVECGSSMKSVINPYCRYKAYKRNEPLVSYGFELLRRIFEGKVKVMV
jgi:hypothetical protein